MPRFISETSPAGLVGVALALGTAAAGGLGAPKAVWIAMAALACLCIGLAVFLRFRPTPQIDSRSLTGGDLSIRVAASEAPDLDLPTIHFKLNRSEKPLARLRPGQPQSVVFEIWVENPNRASMAGVNANILFPLHLRSGDDARCDLYGEPVPGGTWMPPTPHRIYAETDAWKEYWATTGLTLISGSGVFGFKLYLTEPGDYAILAKFWGGDLTRGIEEPALLRVTNGDGGEPAVRDRLSEVIYKGEQLAGWEPDRFTGESMPIELQAWIFEAAEAVPDKYVDLYNRRQDRVAAPKTGGRYWEATIKADLRSLYDIRARLGVEV